MQDRLKASAKMGNIKQVDSPLKNTSKNTKLASLSDQNHPKNFKNTLSTPQHLKYGVTLGVLVQN